MKPRGLFLSALSFLLVPAVSHAVVVTYNAILSGPNESPPVNSPGIGTATAIYSSDAHTLFVSASFSNLLPTTATGAPSGTTAAHIHAPTPAAGIGTAGVATQTPSFAGFPLGVTSGTFSNTFDLLLASSFNPAFVTANGGTLASAEAALVSFLGSGQAYFNIHTTAFGGGEIRGFLAASPASVPEDASTVGLLLLGIGALLAMRRRFSRSAN
jgi:MYXO-CTERM domain-containing protein